MLPEFAYHKPSEEGLATMKYFRTVFSTLLEDMRSKVPSCAELTLAQRHLEYANMRLNKAINLTDPKAEIQI